MAIPIDSALPEALVMSPPNTRALPESENAPAVEANWIPLQVRPAVKSLTGVRRVEPSNRSRSPWIIVLPTQFRVDCKLLFAAPPDHVRLAARESWGLVAKPTLAAAAAA